MWSLLGSLISNFLLLRDLFGYAIPGAVFLALADYFERPDLSNVPMVHDSVWLKFVVVVTASYVVGHVLAAIGYLPYDIATGKKFFKTQKELDDKVADALRYRYLYPSMFIEADRRETLTILRVCLSVALILAALLLQLPGWLHLPLLGIGLFMLLNAYMSMRVANHLNDLSIAAAKKAKTDKIPPFNWSSGNGSDK